MTIDDENGEMNLNLPYPFASYKDISEFLSSSCPSLPQSTAERYGQLFQDRVAQRKAIDLVRHSDGCWQLENPFLSTSTKKEK